MGRQIKLSRRSSNRNALLQNLVSSLVINGRLVTTEQRAKAAKPLAEKILSRANDLTLANQRYIRSSLNQVAADHLINNLGAKLDRQTGGVVRIIKVVPRKGDAANRAFMSVIVKKEEPKATKKEPVKKQ